MGGLPASRRFFERPDAYLRQDYFIDLRCEIIRDLAGRVAQARILDLGCGDGRLSLQFSDEALSITLVDFSEAMLQQAIKRVPPHVASKVRTAAIDLEAFEPGVQFDLVLCVGVLAHLPSLEAGIRKVADLVALGGIAIIQITDAETFLGRFWLRYERARRRVTQGTSHWLRSTSRTDVVRHATASGLRLERVRKSAVYLPGMGTLPNRVLGRWARYVASHRRLSSIGADAFLRFRKT